jgi:hypothetical protein
MDHDVLADLVDDVQVDVQDAHADLVGPHGVEDARRGAPRVVVVHAVLVEVPLVVRLAVGVRGEPHVLIDDHRRRPGEVGRRGERRQRQQQRHAKHNGRQEACFPW